MSDDPNTTRIEQEQADAEHPFVVFSIMARSAERLAAGETLHGCDPSDVPPEGHEVDAERVAAWLASVREGRHWLGDGCANFVRR